jgi:hypothetical protein
LNQANIYANLSAEWSSTVGQLINRAPLNDPRGREKLESKADPASRGVESRIERTHLIGSVMMGFGSDPSVLNPGALRSG